MNSVYVVYRYCVNSKGIPSSQELVNIFESNYNAMEFCIDNNIKQCEWLYSTSKSFVIKDSTYDN